MSCPLCSALRDSYRLIYEDEVVFCIVTKWPLKRGHVMILPKRHVEDLRELTAEESKALFTTIGRIKEVLEQLYGESTITHINSGIHSSQKHLHIHVLPSKGSLRMLVSSLEGLGERVDSSQEEMSALRDEVKQVLLNRLNE